MDIFLLRFYLIRCSETKRKDTFAVFLDTKGISINYLFSKHFIHNIFKILLPFSSHSCFILFIFHSKIAHSPIVSQFAIDIPMLIRIERLARREERIPREIDDPRQAECGVFEDDSVRLRRQRRGIN